mmetsp:Transcript_12064/g.22648  ORF Transcript_12064/g.22648 Transcript_12064/m.22648 type:complete len:325 (-) Transcript_12064:104-1078(-)
MKFLWLDRPEGSLAIRSLPTCLLHDEGHWVCLVKQPQVRPRIHCNTAVKQGPVNISNEGAHVPRTVLLGILPFPFPNAVYVRLQSFRPVEVSCIIHAVDLPPRRDLHVWVREHEVPRRSVQREAVRPLSHRENKKTGGRIEHVARGDQVCASSHHPSRPFGRVDAEDGSSRNIALDVSASVEGIEDDRERFSRCFAGTGRGVFRVQFNCSVLFLRSRERARRVGGQGFHDQGIGDEIQLLLLVSTRVPHTCSRSRSGSRSCGGGKSEWRLVDLPGNFLARGRKKANEAAEAAAAGLPRVVRQVAAFATTAPARSKPTTPGGRQR